ncbi:mechanosensitive ion channel family protein [Candidatus Woesearchaeota archaeon]|nr:mechanosensitive ion channel family protein [Candidatus Woesearchaeota archaeon]
MALPIWMYDPYVRAISILLGSFIAAYLIHFVLKKFLLELTAKTKSKLDDIAVRRITAPIAVFVIFLGVYFSLKYLSYLTKYAVWVHGTFFVVISLLVAWFVAGLLSALISKWLQVHKRYQKTPQLLNKVVIVIVYLFAFIIILSYFDVEITPLITALGVGGLAVGLALQNTLSNFFAGLHIISDQPIKVGDFIQLTDADLSGYVEDIGWRSTRIKTLSNSFVIVPNAKLAESTLVNNSMPIQEMGLVIPVGVAYESNLEKVEKVTIDVAKQIQKKIKGAVKDFKPFIRYNEFADSNINFSVILRIENYVDKYLVKHEFMKALKKRYDKEKIEIAWPVRKVYFADSKGKLKNKMN